MAQIPQRVFEAGQPPFKHLPGSDFVLALPPYPCPFVHIHQLFVGLGKVGIVSQLGSGENVAMFAQPLGPHEQVQHYLHCWAPQRFEPTLSLMHPPVHIGFFTFQKFDLGRHPLKAFIQGHGSQVGINP